MKKKILIVDDEPSVVSLLSVLLKANGYEIYVAYDCLQGFNSALEVKPDLILLDFEMPAGSGIKVFEKLKASAYTSMIPVIFITAYPGEEIKKQIMDLGADGFFHKPLIKDDLLNKINELIGE